MSQQDSLFQEPAAANQPAGTSAGSSTPFTTPQAHQSDSAARLNAAERQVSNLLILLLVVSGTLAIYLLQEVRYDRADLVTLAPQEQQLAQAQQLISNYNQRSVPAMQNFLKQLTEYAKAHPDVLPVLAKYGLVQRNRQPSDAVAEPAP